ncbi:MAG: cell division protein ZapA [Burkholderiales bacterium]
MDQIDVRILDRDYRLAVPADEKARLLDAVRVVDEKMRSIRDAGRVAGVDRIAVMAALQLAHDLIDAREAAAAAPQADASRRIRAMTEELDVELRRQDSLF